MKNKLTQEQLYLGAILLFALILRGFNFFDLSYMNDELSALSRTKVHSISELFTIGILPDGHPPLVQVFLYFWTMIFGYGEAIVKCPFLIVGMLSLYFLYRMVKEFTENMYVALGVTLFFAVNQMHLSYSSVARMYITGFMFSVALALYWLRWIRTSDKKYLLWMIVFAVLCAYNHHFSFLFALLVWVSGWFLIAKEQQKTYCQALGIVFLAYLPNLMVLYHQLTVTEKINWMTGIDPLFPELFFKYFFHYNTLLIIVFALGIFFSMVQKPKIKGVVLIGFCWFLATFVIGYLYSILFTPILQYHLLIFSSPFLVMPVFYAIAQLLQFDLKKTSIAYVAIAGLGLFSLVYSRQHFKLFPKQPYSTLANTIKGIEPNMGRVLVVSDLNLKYLDFYLKEEYKNIDTLSENRFFTKNYQDILNTYEYIISASASVATEAFFTPEFEPLKKSIQSQFCEIEILQRRKKADQSKKLISETTFSTSSKQWILISSYLQDKEGKKAYIKPLNEPWGPNFETALDPALRAGLVCLEMDYIGGNQDGKMGLVINLYDTSGVEVKSNIAYSTMLNKSHGLQKAKVFLDLSNAPANASKIKAFHWKISENSTIEIYKMSFYAVSKLNPKPYAHDSLLSFRDISMPDQEPWSKVYQTPEVDGVNGEYMMRLGAASYWFPAYSIDFDKKNTYGFEFEYKAKDIHPNTKIMVSANVGGKNIYYRDQKLSTLFKSNGNTWCKASITFPFDAVSNYIDEPINLQLMLYKESGPELLIKNPVVKLYKPNPFLYSCINPITD